MKIRRHIALLLCILLLIPAGIQGAAEDGIKITLKKGSYISLGSYMGEPIVWRCVGEDENGMLLISRDILCYKSFGYELGRWDLSFLRTWLNSADEAVAWGETVPDAEHTDSNAYADEPGFLTGFTEDEKALIKTVVNKSVVNQSQVPYASVGSEIHVYNSSGVLADTIQNYGEAFGILTEDKVFCPNIKQMETMGINYISEVIAEPRASAVEQSGNAKNRESRSNNHYWLRDGLGNPEFSNVVRCVYPNGRVFFSDVNEGYMGVRPAIYLDVDQVAIGGMGYEAAPYVLANPGSSRPVVRGGSGMGQVRGTAYGTYSSITEGDYVALGRYYGADIIWRCIDVNENGPLMVSDRILTFRSFDATGDHGIRERNAYGSNSWRDSTLRCWLNSRAPEGEIEWPGGILPNSERTGGSNGYSMDKGFLTNFTNEDLSCIKPTMIRAIANVCDIDEDTTGYEVMALRRNINNTSNDDLAYANYSLDTIFVPSIDEARIMWTDFGVDLLAIPTPEALNLNEADIANQAADMTASWWLRDADGQYIDPYGVRIVTQDGWVDRYDAYSPEIGVRPALYLNMETTAFVSGSGEYDDPYRIGGHELGEAFVAQEPTCTEQGVMRRVCSVCGENVDEPIPTLGHSFDRVYVHNQGLYRVYDRECTRCGLVRTERRIGIIPAAVGAAVLAVVLLLVFIRRRK